MKADEADTPMMVLDFRARCTGALRLAATTSPTAYRKYTIA